MPRQRSTKGRKYKSKLEASVAKKLQAMGLSPEYEQIKLPYVLEKTYTPDFETSNGIILEVKGVLLPPDRVKMAAVKEQHPDLDIRFIFMYPHRKIPRLKMTHAEWAEKYGYKWYGADELKKKDLIK